jgi:hypothetical protein
MFPVTITITLHSPAQLTAVMAALNAEVVPEAEPIKPAKPAKAEPKVAPSPQPQAAAPAPSAAVSAAAPAPTAPSTPASSAASPSEHVIEYAQVGAAITSFAAKYGRDAAVQTLAALGVKSGKELKPDQYVVALQAFGALGAHDDE